ncbi:serine hydrolase domain-containing protein [Flagellimonas myxillae]|uniref:serine hydrolase domain-containing protein n=1 Tax=Flagellimonas myxillae TaxID=2942214 RepID=UPI00201E8431|nr:serine hydrolase domain-containing protein [Muricauda myxillae]MCL6266397.1 beta-lactamase family protein [Muricauda myxillae]
MKHLLFTFIFLLVFSIGNVRAQQAKNPLKDQGHKITKVQSKLIFEKAKRLPENAQLSIAIIQNGKVNYFGVKKVKDSLETIQNHQKVFEIGSITKVFTATLLADFVTDEKLHLEDYINDYIDFPIKDDIQFSFKQLATHTSGLPRVPESLSSPTLDLTNPYKDYDEEKLKRYLSEKLVLSANPGEKSEYSNLGVGLLGFILGEIDNSSYMDLVQTKIFDRYDMANSTTLRSRVADKLVIGLNDNGEEVSHWDLAVLMGAGGILSTTEDLTKFALAQFNRNDKVLAMTRMPFHKISDDFATGLAWAIVKTETDNTWYWHNGGTGGYTSAMIIDTESKIGVIVLSNISALGKLTNEVIKLCPELMVTLE